ncbi:hypothetical protein OIU76_006838 [Salix suchowensis]|nr:hypothetical protein OIU76_006838 [Salix suchowensis]
MFYTIVNIWLYVLDRHELELDFKRFWEEFRSSSSEMEKETALNFTVDVFCRLVKQHANVAQLVTMLVETHIFSFVVGRAFVTDIDKLKISSKTRSLDVEKVLRFFSEVTKDDINPGSNLLTAVEALVSGPIDKQSLLDSGILCCLIHILNALLSTEVNQRQKLSEGPLLPEKDQDGALQQVRRLEVEGSVVHIMKALANHPSAAQSLIEDDSLQSLFQMVANGSLTIFSRFKEGLVPLHNIQLHRHAMQILGLLLVNDNGSTARYIRKHHLIKVLLMAVKDFNPDSGDSAYTMGIVDLLLECVELSYKQEAGGVRLREDIHNAHGYQFLVQFALVLSSVPKRQDSQSVYSKTSRAFDGIEGIFQEMNDERRQDFTEKEDPSQAQLSPALSRLLDVLVNLSQTGPAESTTWPGGKSSKPSQTRHSRSRTSSLDRVSDENWEKDNGKVKDLEAVQMLQDIFLKADSALLQAEQPIASELKHTVLSFFVKLLSFDQQYKKVLREVGLLEVLLDDLKQHKFILGLEQQTVSPSHSERKSSSSSFKKHMDSKDAILSSPKLMESSGSGKFPIFEIEGTISVAWDCMVSLVKKAEASQTSFRSANGVAIVLPFLVSNVHRPGVLRILSCLITEDIAQAHPEELGVLVEVLKSGMVTSSMGHQYRLQSDAKCDTMGALWRILCVNTSAQRVFGEATGFSLMLTTLHSFQGDGEQTEESSLEVYMKVFTYLLRLMTAAVCDNAINRTKLHAIISSHTFYDLLSESGLLCVECEKQVIQLLTELALEIVLPPFLSSDSAMSTDMIESGSAGLSY